jgi:hypothetical protein
MTRCCGAGRGGVARDGEYPIDAAVDQEVTLLPGRHSTSSGVSPGRPEVSFVSTGSIPIEMDKYNNKIIIVTIRDPDLFRVEN